MIWQKLDYYFLFSLQIALLKAFSIELKGNCGKARPDLSLLQTSFQLYVLVTGPSWKEGGKRTRTKMLQLRFKSLFRVEKGCEVFVKVF